MFYLSSLVPLLLSDIFIYGTLYYCFIFLARKNKIRWELYSPPMQMLLFLLFYFYLCCIISVFIKHVLRYHVPEFCNIKIAFFKLFSRFVHLIKSLLKSDRERLPMMSFALLTDDALSGSSSRFRTCGIHSTLFTLDCINHNHPYSCLLFLPRTINATVKVDTRW